MSHRWGGLPSLHASEGGGLHPPDIGRGALDLDGSGYGGLTTGRERKGSESRPIPFPWRTGSCVIDHLMQDPPTRYRVAVWGDYSFGKNVSHQPAASARPPSVGVL